MTREEINKIASSDDFKIIVSSISKDRKIIVGEKDITVAECLKQYNPHTHKVADPKERPDKIISEEGEIIHDAINGLDRNTTDYATVKVNRLPIPVQKRIVLIAATFLIGDKINLESTADNNTDKELEKHIRKVWKDTKLDFQSKEIAKLMMSETHCAELWYDYEDKDYWRGTSLKDSIKRFGVKILAESKGDKLFPVFDEYDDLIAFGRGYHVVKGNKSIEHFDLYTSEKIIQGVRENANAEWEYDTKVNPYGAIPVIYYSQDAPEWADVQALIERKESRFSDFADTNDYFADPALIAEGDVKSLPGKAEVGKSYQVTGGGKVSYLTWDSAPDAIKMEFEYLDKEIYANTHTPDVSFESMKGMIGNVSGIALKLLFMDAQIKASDKQENFGILIQRRLNLLKRMVASLSKGDYENNTLDLYPIFKPYMPINDVEYNELLIKAYEAGMISKKTMVSKSTLVQDAETELEELEKEPKKVEIMKNNM